MDLFYRLILLTYGFVTINAKSILLDLTSTQDSNTTLPTNHSELGNGTSNGQRSNGTNQVTLTPALTIGIAVGGAVLFLCIIIGIILLIRCRSRQRTSPINVEVVPVNPKECGIRPRNSKLPHQYVNVNIKEDAPDAIDESSSGNSPSSVSSGQNDESPADEDESTQENAPNDVVEYDSFDDDYEDDENKEETDDGDSSEFTDSEQEETATDDDIYKNEVLIKLVNSVSTRKCKSAENLNSEQTQKGNKEKMDSYETVELNLDQPTSNDVIREISQSLVKRHSKSKRSSKKEDRYTHDGSYHLESYENVELSDSCEKTEKGSGRIDGETINKNSGNCLKPNEYIKSKKRSGVKPTVALKPPKRHTIHDTACYDEKRDEIKTVPPKTSPKPAVRPKKGNKNKPVVMPKKDSKPAVKLPSKVATRDTIAFFNTTNVVVPSVRDADTGSDYSGGRDKSNVSVKYAAIDKDRKQKAQSQGW